MTRDEAINRIAEMIVSYKQEDEDDTSFNFDDEDIKALDMAISALSAFEGMTNGEVIQTLFPNAEYEGGFHFMHITNVNSIGEVCFPWKWWNSPYKAESEVNNGRN